MNEKISALQKKIEQLEERIKVLEQRPIYIPQYYFTPQPLQPSPVQAPYWTGTPPCNVPSTFC